MSDAIKYIAAADALAYLDQQIAGHEEAIRALDRVRSHLERSAVHVREIPAAAPAPLDLGQLAGDPLNIASAMRPAMARPTVTPAMVDAAKAAMDGMNSRPDPKVIEAGDVVMIGAEPGIALPGNTPSDGPISLAATPKASVIAPSKVENIDTAAALDWIVVEVGRFQAQSQIVRRGERLMYQILGKIGRRPRPKLIGPPELVPEDIERDSIMELKIIAGELEHAAIAADVKAGLMKP